MLLLKIQLRFQPTESVSSELPETEHGNSIDMETCFIFCFFKNELLSFPGCPEGKKVEFITSLLDALTTDMVQAINSAAPAGGGRWV